MASLECLIQIDMGDLFFSFSPSFQLAMEAGKGLGHIIESQRDTYRGILTR
jgi:hypothetical protein